MPPGPQPMPPPPPAPMPGGAPVPAGAGPGGPPPDLPPELVALIEQIAQAVGVPPGLVLDYLRFLVDTQGEQAGLDFLTAPPEQQRAQLQQFAQQQGAAGPGQPPPVGAPDAMGPPGPPP